MTVGVYVIIRDDLHLCYVGQSVNAERRVHDHLNDERAYLYDELVAPPGGEPRWEIMACASDRLNDAEYATFHEMELLGYWLINRHRAKGAFGGSVGSQRSGLQNGKLVAAWNAARRASDPEFAAWSREHLRRASAAGAAAVSERWKSDPEFAARQSENSRRNQSRRRRCDDCGKIMNPLSLGYHQKTTGHSGYSAVDTAPATQKVS